MATLSCGSSLRGLYRSQGFRPILCLLLPIVHSVSDGCRARRQRILVLLAAGGGLGGLHLVLVGLFAGLLRIAIFTFADLACFLTFALLSIFCALWFRWCFKSCLFDLFSCLVGVAHLARRRCFMCSLAWFIRVFCTSLSWVVCPYASLARSRCCVLSVLRW